MPKKTDQSPEDVIEEPLDALLGASPLATFAFGENEVDSLNYSPTVRDYWGNVDIVLPDGVYTVDDWTMHVRGRRLAHAIHTSAVTPVDADPAAA